MRVWLIWLLFGAAWLACANSRNRQQLLAADSEQLVARLTPIISAHKGRVSVAIRNLATGESYHHEADRPMPTASLIKFPVMVTAYRESDAGRLDLSHMLVVRAEDKVQGSGILTRHFSPGAQISVRDAIRLMIAYSDNTATNLVLDQIGLRTTATTMEELGFPDTKVHAQVFRGETSVFPERSKQFGLGSTTARNMIDLLQLLHARKLASPAACDAMLDHLLACEDRDKLPRNLPPEIKIAHKTGSVNAVRTDAGIVFLPNGPVAICVLTAENEDTRWSPENAGEILCARIARVAYDHFAPAGLASEVATRLVTGASGPLVESLQRTLNARLTPSPELSADGEFGPQTREAVVRFQKERKLTVSGEVDTETWQALGALITGPSPVDDPAKVNGESLTTSTEFDPSAPPLVTCKAWAIADAKTGILLWGANERDLLDIASTTKIMTAYLILDFAVRDPEILDEVVTFSARADATIGSSAELRAGEQVSVREILYGLLLPSGNDAAVALAEHFGARLHSSTSHADPLEQFVAAMNRTARSLGMTDTRYSNPHGLTAPGHVSNAADLLVLARAARQLPLFSDYVTTRQRGSSVSSIAGYTRNVLWRNTNKLLALDGYTGIKTGTTDAAGACLVSSGRRGNDELLMVVLGSANSDARYVDTRNLYRWAWSRRQEVAGGGATVTDTGAPRSPTLPHSLPGR